MLRDNIYIHPPSFLFLCLWECDISIEGRRPGHRTEYSAHVFNVKTSPAGSCSIFPQSTWALCPKRWDFLCIQVTGCNGRERSISPQGLNKAWRPPPQGRQWSIHCLRDKIPAVTAMRWIGGEETIPPPINTGAPSL